LEAFSNARIGLNVIQMQRYARHLSALFQSELTCFLAKLAPWLISRSLQRGLHTVWSQGDWKELPQEGIILAANHHSWWDGYLAWLVIQKTGRPSSLLMGAEQLSRFRFFSRLGAISHKAPHVALRRLRRGHMLFIFPEGALRPHGEVAEIHPGLDYLAVKAQTPVYPLALRVVMRGAQHPEAFLVLGEPLAPSEGVGEAFRSRMNSMLLELDRRIANTEPEGTPQGVQLWLRGRGSLHERTGWLERWWN
jgi:1-acyl-sn-glycerol-3-phosphate acyltransferase